jgi:hypothetical protein
MGVAEIVGFAACWLMVATLMLWGVFTEKKRGAMRVEPPAGATGPAAWHPSRTGRGASAGDLTRGHPATDGLGSGGGSRWRQSRGCRRGEVPGLGVAGLARHRHVYRGAGRRSHRGHDGR